MHRFPFEQRTISTCPFRIVPEQQTGDELAICQVVQQATGFPADLCRVSQQACAACCNSPWPGTEKWNSVISSMICEAASRVIQLDGVDQASIAKACRVKQEAIGRLELLPHDPATAISIAREVHTCCYLGDSVSAPGRETEFRCHHPAHEVTTTKRCRSCRDWALTPALERMTLPQIVPVPERRSGQRVVQWAVGVTTSPRRESTLSVCLESLVRAGWESLYLFVDAGAEVPNAWRKCNGTWRDHRVGAWPNFYLGLAELALQFPQADAFMMVQDDICFYDAVNLREYLETILWPGDRPGIVSLYSTEANSARVAGWHTDPYRWLNGALAFIFPPDLVELFLSDRRVIQYRKNDSYGGTANIDLLIGNWAEARQCRVWYPFPSLVQHVGNTTTIWTGADNSGLRRSHWFAGDVETTFQANSTLCSFDESEFPPAEMYQTKYHECVQAGADHMKRNRVVICSLCRDVRVWLPRTAARIERLGQMFHDYRVVLFENDSTDQTLEFLVKWRERNSNVHLHSRRFGNARYPQIRSLERATHLAAYRNICLDYAVTEFGEFDYLIVVDSDLRGGWSYDGVANTFGHPDWDFVGSNGIFRRVQPSRPPKVEWRYFDTWAFRGLGGASDDPNKDATAQEMFQRGYPLVKVWSCFGGMGVYRMESIRRARYDGEDCEHVRLHHVMRQSGFDRLFLNPNQIVLY